MGFVDGYNPSPTISWQKKSNEFLRYAANGSKISIMWSVVTVPKTVNGLLAFRNFCHMEVKRDYHIFTRKNGSFFEQDLDPNHIDSYLKLAMENWRFSNGSDK